MLSPTKKLTKKEIKEDALFAAFDRWTIFYTVNKKYINYALTGVAVLVVGMFIYTNNHRANEEKAAVELAKVFNIYDGGATNNAQYQIAVDGRPEQGIMGLKAIVENYGGTNSGGLARFYLANAYFYLGNQAEALNQFERFDGDNHLLHASALAGAANCYEIKSEYGKAASMYEKAARMAEKNMAAAEYMSSAARCFGLSGEKERAISLLKQLKKDFPTSPAAREVDRYVSQLSA